MQTEKATYDPDLPHLFEVAHNQAGACGLCGRPSVDALHHTVAQRASATSGVLVTEKGS